MRTGLLAIYRAVDPRTRRGQLVFALLAVAVTAAVMTIVLTRHQTTPVAAPKVTRGPGISSSGAAGTPTLAGIAGATQFRCSKPSDSDGGDKPVRVCAPDIGVDADVMSLGLNADRTVQVPPLSQVGDAGWYRYSAAPGEVGPTVVLGHIDSARYGEGVFFHLARMRRGETVIVTRADGKTATYTVDRVQEVAKSRFPSQDVYGPTSGPALRLVTCGGPFDAAQGNYLDNVIVYGTLQSLST